MILKVAILSINFFGLTVIDTLYVFVLSYTNIPDQFIKEKLFFLSNLLNFKDTRAIKDSAIITLPFQLDYGCLVIKGSFRIRNDFTNRSKTKIRN